MSEGDNFLRRWSARKKAQTARPVVDQADEVATRQGRTLPSSPVEGTPADPATPSSTIPDPALSDGAAGNALPDPETLEAGSDFKAFMARDVAPELRRAALRKLWRSNPVLANVDGLVDYGEDFTDKARVPRLLASAYRVGKGWLSDEELTANRALGEPPMVADAEAAALTETAEGTGTESPGHASPNEDASQDQSADEAAPAPSVAADHDTAAEAADSNDEVPDPQSHERHKT